MTLRQWGKWLACGILVSMTIAVTSGAAGPQAKCIVGKNRCVAKTMRALLECHQRAETPGKVADPNFRGCADKAKAKFDGGSDPRRSCFEKLENKSPNDCITFDDTALAQSLVGSCVDQIVEAIDPAPIDQSRCSVGKKKCAAKRLMSMLECYRKAEMSGRLADPNSRGCLDKARAKFDGGGDPTRGCFERLERKSGNGCLAPLDNTAAVAGIIDSCVLSFVSTVETTTTTTIISTTTVTITTTTTTTLPCVAVGGVCWYLSSPFDYQSCDATCAAQGLAYDTATDTYAGSSGTNANCQAVLTALGHPGAVFDASLGFGGIGCSWLWGCMYDPEGCTGYREVGEATTSEASTLGYLRACACK